jgi:hypothetical protein
MLRVTEEFGTGADLGLMTPRVGMVTNLGTIQSIGNSIDANLCVVGSGAPTEGKFTEYPEHLLITLEEAEVWGWPTLASGCVLFGHDGTHVAGTVNNNVGAYADGGNSIKTFTRSQNPADWQT